MGTKPWKVHEGFSGHEFNPLSDFAYTEAYNSNVPITDLVARLFKDKYEYDLLSSTGTGPHLAVVLKVLSGPQAKTHSPDIITKSLFKAPEALSLLDNSARLRLKPGPIRVIAKVPNIHQMPWPSGIEDEFGISLFPEFVASKQIEHDSAMAKITEGALVWVDLSAPTSKTGILIGLHDTNFIAKIEEAKSASKAFDDTCTLPKVCAPSEVENLYAGSTSHKFKLTGPPIRKVKGKIKTGMYGDGFEQTKSHFDECLKHAGISFKHSIAGPTPDSKNAFVWVGHLNGNGANDLVDRPPGPGRETIIYASKTLDITSPIEIKYYFHDIAGFGFPWINGPETTVAEAKSSAKIANNDLRMKVAANLKDLIRDGRNFVLVIPEMLHSRGFGTKLGDVKRIKNYTKCSTVPRGETTKIDLIRTNMESVANRKAIPVIKDYLDSISDNKISGFIEKERVIKTFVDSGDLNIFHNEIIEVLQQYIYKNIAENIEYVSILAEGAGALSLAGSLPLVYDIPLNRIDFVPNGFDEVDRYSFFDYSNISEPEAEVLRNIPSYVLYKLFIEPSAKKDLEFNYIVDDAASFIPLNFGGGPGSKHFFDLLGRETEFVKNFKQGGSGAEKKFDFWVNNNINNNTSISCYVGGKKRLDYTFSMINKINAPHKSDTIPKVGMDYVPNHAQNISAKQKSAAASNYNIKIEQYKKKAAKFEEMLFALATGGLNSLCKISKYKVYCTDIGSNSYILKYGEESMFHRRYDEYLHAKIEIPKLEQLKEGHVILVEAGKDKVLIDTRLKEYEDLLKTIKANLEPAKAELAKLQIFKPGFFNSAQTAGTLGTISSASDLVGRQNAVEDIIKRLKGKQKSANPDCSLPEKCRSKPTPLGEFSSEGVELLEPSLFNCEGSRVQVVKKFDILSEWIPYYPKKDDFTFESQTSVYGKTSSKKVDMKTKVPDFKTATFKYKVRRGRGVVREETSPPVWSCVAPIFKEAYAAACEASNYIPFKIASGIKNGYAESGTFVSSYGLSINIDPFIAPYTRSIMSHSVFTGAWTPGIGDDEFLTFMGVFKLGAEFNAKNMYDRVPNYLPGVDVHGEVTHGNLQSLGWRRKMENLNGNSAQGIPTAETPAAAELEKYLVNQKLAGQCKGNYIVPPDANPTLWAIVFCEKSGAKWGNSQFLKRKQNGGVWTNAEKRFIADKYGIDNVVGRVRNISWPVSTFDNHSYFQFWSGAPLVTWDHIKKIAEAKGINQ